jgi:hypothetical protein
MMTIKLELKPEVEASLAAGARAKGIPLDAYLQSVIEQMALDESTPPASLEEFRATLDTLAGMGRNLPRLPSAAFSRESIYQDHD